MTELITTAVWSRIRSAVKASSRPADVAVAYLGKGGARLMPLPKGSRLLVDASDGAVKSGQTCPDELRKLRARGVRVFSAENLHAKVFVLGGTAFVGSANVSRHSAHVLEEAVVATTDGKVVAAAREFVRSRCLHELGPEALKRLGQIYIPPRITGGKAGARPKKGPRLQVRPMRVALLQPADPPEGSDDASERGHATARKRMERPRSHELDEFFWRRECPFRERDLVIQILREPNGKRMVSAPATVTHIERWSRGLRRCTFVYVERPKRRRVELDRFARRVGRGAKQRLLRGGAVASAFAQRLLAAWAD